MDEKMTPGFSKLPGLNGLRSIAAFFVLLVHVFQIAAYNGDHKAMFFYVRYDLIGKSMVNLFFVISGFIITYVLYREKGRSGAISIRNFYFKRILRIWPLYFGILLVVSVLSMYAGLFSPFSQLNGTALMLLLLFAVNLKTLFGDLNFSVFPHYWSLSVEEQFYIFWPLIFKFLRPEKVIRFCVLLIAGMFLFRSLVSFLVSHLHEESLRGFQDVLYNSMFGSIAIGIIGAHLVVHRSPWLRFFYLKPVQVIAWIIFVSTVVYPYYIPYVYAESFAIADLVLILNVTSNKGSLLSMENKFLDYTGKISYGIYMFHWPLVAVVVNGMKAAGVWDFSVRYYQIPLLLISVVVIYVAASLSYRYFESYFLKIKPAH